MKSLRDSTSGLVTTCLSEHYYFKLQPDHYLRILIVCYREKLTNITSCIKSPGRQLASCIKQIYVLQGVSVIVDLKLLQENIF